jgi:hypothetical protein
MCGAPIPAAAPLDSTIQLLHDIRTGMISSKPGHNVVDEKNDHAASCQYIPLPQGGAIVTCPSEVGAVKVDGVNPYLGIGVLVFIVLAVAIGLKLTSTREP